MPTVIDSLIIELQLDPKQFTKGQKEAAQAFLKTRDQAVSGGKAVEEASKKMADSISRVTKEVLVLSATFLGVRGLKEFINDLVTADAALGRFGRNLDTAPQTISAWQAAAERMGGSGADVAATFERIGSSLYNLKRNGQLLPKEFSQLQALTGKRIDTTHGVDKFLRDTAAALKEMAAIDPSQVHFLAQGMGIDDATANVMIKYGDAIGTYIDQLKKLAPTSEAIKASQELQDHWVTLQQTAVSLCNTILCKHGATISNLLTQMTEWVTKNQEWIRSNIVDGIKQFADYLKQIDWVAVGKGLHDFANGAHTFADELGGVVRATEILFGLWAGAKFLQVLSNIKGLVSAVGGGSTASAAAGTAASGSGFLATLGVGAAGIGATIAILMAGKSHILADPKSQERAARFEKWRQGEKGPDYSSLTRDPGAHGEKLNETLVDGSPVSKANPMPTISVDANSGASGGFWSTVGTSIATALGFGGGTPSIAGQRPGLTRPAPFTGPPATTGSNKEVKDFVIATAKQYGIDPNVMLRVGMHEGLGVFDPTKPDRGGDGGSSFGPFQLHYGGINPSMPHAGLGDDFTKQTGLDARDPNTWKQQVVFTAQQVRKGGWRPWMGAAAEGIYGKTGVGPMPPAGASASALSSTANDNRVTTSSSSNEMHIGSVNVQTQATDANGIAGSIGPALQRSSLASTANYGPR